MTMSVPSLAVAAVAGGEWPSRAPVPTKFTSLRWQRNDSVPLWELPGAASPREARTNQAFVKAGAI
jgi:hypothetical protein